jgi:hypothetical protein
MAMSSVEDKCIQPKTLSFYGAEVTVRVGSNRCPDHLHVMGGVALHRSCVLSSIEDSFRQRSACEA